MWCQTNSGGQNVQTTGAYQKLSALLRRTFTGTPFTDPAGTAAFDCPIPVFVDRFPSPGPLPILYLRARTGAKGVVWDNITGTGTYDGNGNEPADYQYDLRDIYPYTCSHIGLPANNSSNNAVTHNLIGIGTSFSGPVAKTTAAKLCTVQTVLPNGGLYFTNQSIPPTTGSDPNFTGRPRAVDQFILISAGPDGIYGTLMTSRVSAAFPTDFPQNPVPNPQDTANDIELCRRNNESVNFPNFGSPFLPFGIRQSAFFFSSSPQLAIQ